MSIAFVFPGQGSQSVGMLTELAAESPLVAATFTEASVVLGYDLWELTQRGPADALNATERTQPAMLAAGIACWRVWLERGGARPTIVTGHSLGEFTALVAAEAIGFEQCLRLVAFRGRAMQDAVPPGTGAMAALLGLDDAAVGAACDAAMQAGGVAEAVNFNSPGQVVIAGDTAAVQRAIEFAKTGGAKRAVLLPVSVPSHSRLMQPAANRLAEELRSVEIRTPQIEFRSAVDGNRYAEPASIRDLLARQLVSPVRWTDAVQGLLASGIGKIYECGPGKVLASLCQRIARGSTTSCASLDTPAAFAAALTTQTD
ncbi:MAG TPA: ACP S-malonyltransferase [Steroidobacteraceae bacterium]|nr:ACP S-malonyltransferase [Steroidobacteraceae bacterium]HRX90744.1 ACP S-malonyltransferase [Steroidobacteraceae bacterium]